MENPLCATCRTETLFDHTTSHDGDEIVVFVCAANHQTRVYAGTDEVVRESLLHFKCVICREEKTADLGRDIGTGSWACDSHFERTYFGERGPALIEGPSPLVPFRFIEAAAVLVRQYQARTGPTPGDPFDPDLWMHAAAELLNGGTL